MGSSPFSLQIGGEQLLSQLFGGDIFGQTEGGEVSQLLRGQPVMIRPKDGLRGDRFLYVHFRLPSH